MTDCRQLLADYAQKRSESAFRELVARYIDLVYSSALRLVDGDAHRAQDVTQVVFANLAQKAGQLSPEVMLGGWLHRHTCFVAANTMRGERRRQAREREAVEMNSLHDQADADFSRFAPLIDETINQLDESDRTAILLRFFEQKDFRAVGQALHSSEDAARMRVNRALEKLRDLLARRGIHTTAAALSVIVSTQAVQAAPVGLAVTISATALAGTAVTTSTVITTTTKAIAMTTLQKTIITTTVALLAGTAIYETRQARQLHVQNQTLQQQQSEQMQQLQHDRDDAANRLEDMRAENLRLKSNPNQNELLKLRGEVAQLRSELASAQTANNSLKQKAASGSAPMLITFPAGQTIQLDQAKLNLAGAKPGTPENLDFKDVGDFQNSGNATVESGAQTALWEVLKNEGRGFDKITSPGDDTGDEAANKLFAHLSVELSGASQIAFEKPAEMGQDYSLVNFHASWPKDQGGNAKSTSGLLGFRRNGDGWYLDRFTPQSQGLMITAPGAASK